MSRRRAVLPSVGLVAVLLGALVLPLGAPPAEAAAVQRIAGSDRYQTSALIAQAVAPAPGEPVFLATGTSFADALAAGPVAAAEGGVLLLTSPSSLPAATVQAITAIAPREIVIVGGTGAISDEVAAEALVFAGQLVRGTLDALRQSERTPAGIVRAYGGLLEGWMAKSGYSDGCPITTTLLEVATDKPAIAEIGRKAFAEWQAVFADALQAAGVEANRAGELGLAAIMMIEGSLILARVQRNGAPIRVATQEVAALFERACSQGAGAS